MEKVGEKSPDLSHDRLPDLVSQIVTNTQIMLLASYLEQFLEQNTEKDRNCKKNRHCIHGGKAVILTKEEMADLIDQAEAT